MTSLDLYGKGGERLGWQKPQFQGLVMPIDIRVRDGVALWRA
jgi:hypothetical protein